MPWATSQFKTASGRFVFRGRLDDKPVLPPHGYLHLVLLVTEQAINSQINEERQRDLASVRVHPRTARSHGLREGEQILLVSSGGGRLAFRLGVDDGMRLASNQCALDGDHFDGDRSVPGLFVSLRTPRRRRSSGSPAAPAG